MKFNIKYTKFGNKFFFISNLAEWHFSCRKKYNQRWLSFFISPIDKNKAIILKSFGKILKKRERWNGKANFPLSTSAIVGGDLKSVTKIMTTKEKKIVEKTFFLFRAEFEKIWKGAFPIMKGFSALFKKQKYQRLIKRGEKMLEIYFGEPSGKKLDIYLLMAPTTEKGGGGANIGPNRITIEIGDISDAGINWISRIILHEASHILYQNQFNDLVKKFIKSIPRENYKNFKTIELFKNIEIPLRELITSSIIANGIIDENVFKFPLKKQLKEDIKFLNWNNYSLSSLLRKSAGLYLNQINKEYLKKKKQIDIAYLNHAWEFLKKFEEKYKKGKFGELSFCNFLKKGKTG